MVSILTKPCAKIKGGKISENETSVSIVPDKTILNMELELLLHFTHLLNIEMIPRLSLDRSLNYRAAGRDRAVFFSEATDNRDAGISFAIFTSFIQEIHTLSLSLFSPSLYLEFS